MKYLLVLVVCAIPKFSLSQEITEFWGIPFGTKMDSVKVMVLSEHGLSPTTESNKKQLVFKPQSFAGESPEWLAFAFSDGWFSAGYAAFRPDKEAGIINLYNRLKDKISTKYFDPQQDIEKYSYPYSKGDGHILTAISLEKAVIGCIWSFGTQKKPAGKITLLINSGMYINLYYQDAIYSVQAESKQEKEDLNDL